MFDTLSLDMVFNRVFACTGEETQTIFQIRHARHGLGFTNLMANR